MARRLRSLVALLTTAAALKWHQATAPKSLETKGKTARCRLRPVDRAVLTLYRSAIDSRALDGSAFVDVGYGASPTTTLESARQFRAFLPSGRDCAAALPAVGLEQSAERVRVARDAPGAAGVTFHRGGFDVRGSLARADGPPAARVVRAMNVLRQDYSPAEADRAHAALVSALPTADAVVVEGTCDKFGRLHAVNVLKRRSDGTPKYDALVFFASKAALRDGFTPLDLRAVLPKSFIHDCVPGNAVHDFLAAWDAEWRAAAALHPRARFIRAGERLADDVVGVRRHRRLLTRGFLVWSFDDASTAADVVFRRKHENTVSAK